MSYRVTVTEPFDKAFKRLSKKYPSLKRDLRPLVEQLKENPFTGTFLGKSCYKIRLAISSKGKGKSGGARVITFVRVIGSEVFLLAIYDKSEMENINDQELDSYLAQLGFNKK